MNSKNQFVITAVVAAAIIAGAIFGLIRRSPTTETTPASSSGTNTAAAGTATNPAATTTPPAQSGSGTGSGVVSTRLTYTQAVAKYQNQRMQFDSACNATPNNVTFKDPATVMLDNRGAAARKIAIGSYRYSLAAYGFAVVTLSQKTLPTKLYVSCDQKYNVAQILLQK